MMHQVEKYLLQVLVQEGIVLTTSDGTTSEIVLTTSNGASTSPPRFTSRISSLFSLRRCIAYAIHPKIQFIPFYEINFFLYKK